MDDMSAGIVGTIILVLMVTFGFNAGVAKGERDFIEKCDKIGKVIIRDKIYECKEVK